MTRTTDDKIDKIFERVEEMAIVMATISEWKIQHENRHDRESSWKRWIAPFVVSVGMVCWQMFKK